MQTEPLGGLGDIPYRQLHHRMAEYRFLFSPMRYTSLPLAVIEGMTIGMPVVALATTELPTVLQNGHAGFISCDPDELLAGMRTLLARPDEARRMGANARRVALERFGLQRFARAWNDAFMRAIAIAESACTHTLSARPSRVAAHVHVKTQG
jgi:glycosyltransferase involved in cell wall biosynthesis